MTKITKYLSACELILLVIGSILANIIPSVESNSLAAAVGRDILRYAPIGVCLAVPLAFRQYFTRTDVSKLLPLLYLIPLSVILVANILSVKSVIITTNIFLIVCAILLIGIIRPKTTPTIQLSTFKFRRIYYFFFIYFAAIAISFLWTDNKNEAFILLRRSLLWIAMPLAFSTFTLDNKQWQLLACTFFNAALIYAVINIVCWQYNVHTLQLSYADFFIPHKHAVANRQCWEFVYSWSTYDHPSYNAWTLCTALICGITILKNNKHSFILRAQVFLFTALDILIFVITQSRIGIIMIIALALLSIYLFLPTRKTIRLAYLLFLALITAVATVFYVNFRNDFSIDPARQKLFADALAHIKAQPISGVGLGDMPDALDNHLFRNPHNQFLGDWMQSGICALISLVAMLTALTSHAVIQRKAHLLIFLAVSLAFMLIEMPFYLIKGIAIFLTFTLFFIAYRNNART